MISNNYIPEKINDYNVYLDGTKMIGVAASVTLPEVNMKTSTVSGVGVNGELDSPTIGLFEKMEQELQFNTLYSSAMDVLSPLSAVNLTLRAAQQVYDKTGGYDFKGLRVVEMGRVKSFKPGKVEKGEAKGIPQDGSKATYAPMLDKTMSAIDWTKTAQQIHNHVRGLHPWPVATAELAGTKFKIHATAVVDGSGVPGTILGLTKTGLQVACGEGAIEIRSLQAEGGKRMAAPDYFRGHPLEG